MPGQPTPHNPLHAAARETMQVARETKSPWFEKVAIITMIASALTTTAIAALQAVHMLKRDLEKDKERERHASRRCRRPTGQGTAAPRRQACTLTATATSNAAGPAARTSRKPPPPAGSDSG